MKGIFIPEEICDLENLTWTEKIVLSIYRYYTVEGTDKCCYLENKDVADMCMTSERNLRFIKKKLKELGYIRSDGGRRVYYLGVTGEEAHYLPGGSPLPPKRKTITSKEEADFPHNKEIKNKEHNKGIATNFEQVIDRLPDEYKTKDRIDYLYSKYKDNIDNINKITDIEGYVVDQLTMRMQSILMKEYPVEYKIKEVKKEKKPDFIDL